MLSLQKLFHREDKLLSLLESSALQARASVRSLATFCRGGAADPAAGEVTYSRHKNRSIAEEISHQVYSTYIAALDREDIETLSSGLHKITKLSEKFIQRVKAAERLAQAVDYSRQISDLNRATEVVVKLVQSLKGGIDLDVVRKLNDELQTIEGEADKHMLVLYKDLYNGNYTALKVLALKDCYELLEKLIDRCRDAGNIIAHIALKDS